ncbi:MAG: mechanosensitive ion channel domain-containing protein, partial [Succinivibrio sp.]
PVTVTTEAGDVQLPTAQEQQDAGEALKNDSTIKEDERKNRMAELANAQAGLQTLKDVQDQITALKKTVSGASAQLRKLSSDLYKAERQYSDVPSVQKYTADNIGQLIDDLRKSSADVQQELSAATAAYSDLQTLPERAQTTISKNNADIAQISASLQQESDLKNPGVRNRALNMYTMGLQNQLLQAQLENHTLLLDMANYRVRIATIKNSYFQKYLAAAQTRQNELLSASDDSGYDEEGLKEAAKKYPALSKELDANRKLFSHVAEARQEAASVSKEDHDVQEALASLKQMSDSINSEITGLDKTLLLSRLLNRQQTQVPDVRLSHKLDELIPDLTLWLYEIRSRRDDMFDTNDFADRAIKKNPALKDCRDELISVFVKRRELLNDLYQALSSELTTAINLKVKYQEFTTLRDATSAKVTENLFWLKSNQPLGREFLYTFWPSLNHEISQFASKVGSPQYRADTLHTFLTLGVPAAALGLLAFLAGPYVRRLNNRLAGRLDRRDDSILVTPAAILLNILMVIPKAVLWALFGGVVICLCLNSSQSQTAVIGMLLLHIMVFVFFLEILKPNSLAQRHFCISPDVLRHNRRLLNRVWYALIPILIIANTAETDSAMIYDDIAGFMLTMFCSAALMIIAFTWIRAQLHSTDDMSSLIWLISLALLVIPAGIIIAVANGYYYTTVKLVNRIAYTCYAVLFYWILAYTVRRAMYVFQSRIRRRTFEMAIADGDSGEKHKDPERESNLAYFKETLGLENLGAKAYKMANGFLIIVTLAVMYAQWNDLAGALGYLKNVKIWSNVQVIGGKETVVSALTLADVLLAVLIIAVTVLLNRNLPVLLERIFLWRAKGAQLRSTSYTVKIITSYAILAVGLISASGALGIKWENLQWLVAALSVGLGFGLQEIFANFVSGIIILFERQLRVGDIITLGSLSGKVSKIRIRSTTILSFENKEVMIPNREFITSALTNWSLTNTVTMIEFTVGIGYSSDVDKAKRLLHQILAKCRYLTKGMTPLVYVKSLDDSAVTISCEVYVTEIGNRKLTFDYLCSQTLKVFAENGIEIPFNQMDVNVKNLEQGEFIDTLKKGLVRSGAAAERAQSAAPAAE